MSKSTEVCITELMWEIGYAWTELQRYLDHLWCHQTIGLDSRLDDDVDQALNNKFADMRARILELANMQFRDTASLADQLAISIENARNDFVSQRESEDRERILVTIPNDDVALDQGGVDPVARAAAELRQIAPYSWDGVPFQPSATSKRPWPGLEQQFQDLLEALPPYAAAAARFRMVSSRECFPYAGLPSFWSQAGHQRVNRREYLANLEGQFRQWVNQQLSQLVPNLGNVDITLNPEANDEVIRRSIEAIETQVNGALPRAEQVNEKLKFGVRVDQNTRKLRRGTKVSDLLTERQLAFVMLFLNSDDGTASENECKGTWGNAGTKMQSLYQATSQINKAIAALSLEIKKHRGLGYELVDTSAISQT